MKLPETFCCFSPRLACTAMALLMLSACGKKEEAPPPTAPAPAAEVEPAAPRETPSEAKADPAPESEAPATAPAPIQTPPAEAPKAAADAAPAQRSPADAEAWRRWESAAERLRDIGGNVRQSNDPQKLEVELRPMSGEEARLIAGNAYRTLGGGTASVIIYDNAGTQLAEASAGGIIGK